MNNFRAPEVSVVIPCLNEAHTLPHCIGKAIRAAKCAQLRAEVIVADNGSADGSAELALECGARVVHVPTVGYGAALMVGIKEAAGEYVLIGDADNSYDFAELPRFVAKLREGFDLVLGCRLPVGGGTIQPGAMPFTHRWLGNPTFSILIRQLFTSAVHDPYCGLRGFSRAWINQLSLTRTGMEFAVEMVLQAVKGGARITELPTTLYRDGRQTHGSHLRTWRDGWRTIRLIVDHWIMSRFRSHPSRRITH